MKMKKHLALLLTLAMLLSILSACGSQDDGEGTPNNTGNTPGNTSETESTPGNTENTQVQPTGDYPITPEELGSGDVKWAEEKTADGWMKVTNEGGATLGYSPDSGVTLIQVEGLAFKDLNRNGLLDAYEDWRLNDATRAKDLADQLSIEEIAGLMLHGQTSNISAEAEEMVSMLDSGIRSILTHATAYPTDVQGQWNNSMQKYAESLGSGIPVQISTNPRTNGVWPENLALAATFDPDYVFELTKNFAKEYRALGLTTLLGPQIDIASEPRWRRTTGTFGEDPALSRDMTEAYVSGLQSTYDENGNDLGWGVDSVNAMIKHWPSDGAGQSGRESHSFWGQYTVYPGNQFKTGVIPFIDGGLALKRSSTGAATGVMASYSIAYSDDGSLGELIGSAFSEYKNQVLRSYGFAGLICSDWGVVRNNDEFHPVNWGTGDMTRPERYLKAVMAGTNQIGGETDVENVVEAYNMGVDKYGEDTMAERFKDSAYAVLMTYFPTGIFENPYINVDDAVKLLTSNDTLAAAENAQFKSIVMLKNNDSTIKKADGEEKPTVYIPLMYVPATASAASSISLPVDSTVANQYFNVVTDKISDTKTGPVDANGEPTYAYEDIIRATAEEIASCDYAIIMDTSPKNYGGVDGNPGYDEETETYIPISLQYGSYTADSSSVRTVSIAGPLEDVEIENPYGTQYVKQQANISYFGEKANVTNGHVPELVKQTAEKMPENGKVIVAIIASTTFIPAEFEEYADAILLGFGTSSTVTSFNPFLDIISGAVEPSALLPFQMPKDMNTVEAQFEDVPRDMECYVDSNGNTYDFGFGMNWSGVIQDERTKKYCVPALTEPATQPIG